MNFLAHFFGINIGKEEVGKRSFRACEVLGRGCGKSVEVRISSLVSSIETLLKLSVAILTEQGRSE